MFKEIEELLKDRVNEFVFIEIKDDKRYREKGLPSIKNIPLPIPLKVITEKVMDTEKNSPDISLLNIIEGMIFIIGIDSNFMYNTVYKNFLYAFNPNIDEIVVNQGLKYMEINKKLEGLICFKASLYLKDNNLNGLYNYGRAVYELYMDNKENEKLSKIFEGEALRVFEDITIKYPDFDLAYYYLGFCYANSKQYKKAELTWKVFLDINDDDENKKKEVLEVLEKIKDKIAFEEGYTYIINGENSKGLEILVPLSEKYPEWWNLLFFIGLGYRHSKDYRTAIEYFDRALKLKPNQVGIWNELGLSHISLGNVDEAIKFFKKALKLREKDHEILSNLGMAYMEKGCLEMAEEYLKKSLDINPDDEVTKQCMAKLVQLKSLNN